MSTRILSAFLLFTSFPVIALAMPYIHNWQSQEGAKVYFVEIKELPIVDIQIIFDAGSARDGKHPGLASLTNSLLDEGAAGLSADRISQGFDNMGAKYSAGTGRDSSFIKFRSLTDPAILEPALKNLAQVLSRPDFPEGALGRQKKRILTKIRSKQQSPGTMAEDVFFAELFGDHPYAVPVIGKEKSVKALTREDVSGFYKSYYVVKNATLAIAGNLTKQKAHAIAEELLEGLPVGSRPESIPRVPDLKQPATLKIDYPSSQTHILSGQVGLRRGDPDYFPLYVGNHVLGGGGMVSRLFEDIREKRGLSYSVYSYFLPMRERGPFMAKLQTRDDQASVAFEVLQNNLKKFIKYGPDEAELEAAKKNITGSFPLKVDSNAKIIDYLSLIGFYDLPKDYLETFNANVESVTFDQVKAAFNRRLTPDKFLTIMVGPGLSEPADGDTARTNINTRGPG